MMASFFNFAVGIVVGDRAVALPRELELCVRQQVRRARVVDLVGQVPNDGVEVFRQVVVRRLLEKGVREEIGVREPAEPQVPAALVEPGHFREAQVRLLVVATVDGFAQGVEIRVETPQGAGRERHEREKHDRQDEADQKLERALLVEQIRQCHVRNPPVRWSPARLRRRPPEQLRDEPERDAHHQQPHRQQQEPPVNRHLQSAVRCSTRTASRSSIAWYASNRLSSSVTSK